MANNVNNYKYNFEIYLKTEKNKSTLKTVELSRVVELLDKLEPFQKPKMKFVKEQKFNIAQEYRSYQYHCLN